MKKKALLLAAVCAVSMGVCAHTEVIGEVLSTDIGTLIDFEPIKSYNINDYTYIKAEDLRNYGFDVEWNAEARTLSITRNPDAERRICMSGEDINIKKSEIEQRSHLYDVYSTDIKTYLDGEEISACNVDGETLIQTDYLQKFGEYSYNDETRMVCIDMFMKEIDTACENASNKQDLEIASDEYSKTAYSGGLSDGQPDGAGMTIYTKEVPDGLMEQTISIMRGFYKSGQPDGKSYTVTRKNIRGGSAPGVTQTLVTEQYKEGQRDGFSTTAVVYDEAYGPSKFYETNYQNGIQTGAYRISDMNDEYLYGFVVTEEGEYDSEGSVIN